MTNKQRNLFAALLAVCLLSLLGLVWMLPRLPEQIPIHWNFYGEADNYGDKKLLLLFGALPVALLGLFWGIPRWDPGRERYKKHMGPYLFLVVMMTLLLVGMGWIIAIAALGIQVPVERVIPGLVGVMLTGVGNYMPRIRHNYTFGIRTPWTLASEKVWQKTHRAGGFGFVASGLLLILTAFFSRPWLCWASMGVLLLSSALVVAYSWYLYRREKGGI